MPEPTGPFDAGDPYAPPHPVHIEGALDTGALSGEGAVRLRADAIELLSADTSITVALVALDGVGHDDESLTLYLRGGTTLRLSGAPRLGALARELTARVCGVPELTRPLRALGAPGDGDVARDRFFAPLLAARRRAERTSGRAAKLTALDGAALGAALERVLDELVAERARRGPDRRALHAQLLELFEPTAASLAAMQAAARRARRPEPARCLADWREWVACAERSFAEADRFWRRAAPLLAEWPAPPPPLWRRVLRLGALALQLAGGSMGWAA